MTYPRYCIGIDLGTTNCALAFIDTLSNERRSELFPISQHLSETTIGMGELLPSAVALLDTGGHLVGRAALELMEYGTVPVVSSAKSWLIVEAIDRRAPCLPVDRLVSPPATKLSPVDASALYLKHIKDSWNQSVSEFDASYRLEHQQVVVTVPASFDPMAQTLTREAIAQAGLPDDTTLLEEPVAAFHHFLEQDEVVLSQLTKRPALILVVDVGGGTTDFSLLELEPSGALRRIKVGDHLLIGGDTIDFAIGHLVQRNLTQQLSARAWSSVLYQARKLKEAYLSGGHSSSQTYTITIPGEGSNLFATTQTISLSTTELDATILDGFFPQCQAADLPSTRSTALREVGLPFPPDVAITRHLAAFLEGKRVDAVLYTGGTLQASTLQDRLTRLLTRWQQGVSPSVLPNRSFLLAVAHGAARYALSTRQLARRVAMAYPRSLYLDVGNRQLLCVFSQGHHTGDEVIIEHIPLAATTNAPVQLQLLSSPMRPDDKEGDLVALNANQFKPLPPATTTLSTGETTPRSIPVHLAIQLTEVGSLTFSCISEERSHRWTIEFQLSEDKPKTKPEPSPKLREALQAITTVFGKGGSESPSGLMSRLEKILTTPRDTWDVSTLRALWSPLADSLTRRGKSVKHEVAWLQCAGHSLRPGIGDESDSLRINELWRIRGIGTPHRREPSVMLNTIILWRRVAAGLSAERQQELYEDLMKGDTSDPEYLRLFASLERLSSSTKQHLVQRSLKLLSASKPDTQILGLWALSRLGARELLYAARRFVVEPDVVASVAKRILAVPALPEPHRSRTLVTIAQRTRDADRDVEAGLWQDIFEGVSESWQRALSGDSDRAEGQAVLLGDSLPPGIRLRASEEMGMK